MDRVRRATRAINSTGLGQAFSFDAWQKQVGFPGGFIDLRNASRDYIRHVVKNNMVIIDLGLPKPSSKYDMAMGDTFFPYYGAELDEIVRLGYRDVLKVNVPF